MPGRLSLAQQLASIQDVAPQEFDPEAAGFSINSDLQDLGAGRADYLPVSESRLRKGLQTELDDKYSGTRSSRKELYDGPSEEEEDSDGSDGAEGSESASDGNDEGDGDHVEEDYELEEVLPFGAEEDDNDGSEDSSSVSSAQNAAHQDVTTTKLNGKASRRSDAKLGKVDDDAKTILKELRKASSADIAKGREVKKQLGFWDTLLEARIRLQKCTTNVNILPSPDIFPAYAEAAPAELNTAVNNLEKLSEALFALREHLYRDNDKLDTSNLASNKRKRSGTEYVDDALSSLDAIASLVREQERSTISKWSDKVAAATVSGASQNKFKAIGTQNTLVQIDNIIAADVDRLVERTRIRRGGGTKVVKVVGRDVTHQPVAGEKDADPNVYDDTDFYQALLREVVDSGGRHGAAPLPGTAASYASYNNVSRKKASGTLDPKASKGRKIRYHVHEKLQNFMAPIPTDTWGATQIDELFRGLLGAQAAHKITNGDHELEEASLDNAPQIRIF